MQGNLIISIKQRSANSALLYGKDYTLKVSPFQTNSEVDPMEPNFNYTANLGSYLNLLTIHTWGGGL